MNFTKINELKPYDLNCNIFDVYSYEGLSMQELLCQFFTKINECIKTSNETIDLAEWLVNEGLKQETALKLTEWLNDGTLENLINVTLFENLNNKIDNVNSQLEQITNKNVYINGNNNDCTDIIKTYVNKYDDCIINIVGSVKLSDTIEINNKNIVFKGVNGFDVIQSGSIPKDSSSKVIWIGDNNKTMFKFNNSFGGRLENIFLTTVDGNINRNITGVEITSSVLSRYSFIKGCSFNGFKIGIDFGGNFNSGATSEHSIELCQFLKCEEGIRISPSNAYTMSFSKIYFYADANNSTFKKHINCIDGHFSVYDSYFGPLHTNEDEDNISVYIKKGYGCLTNCYAENHRGLFLKWDLAHPNTQNCTSLYNCVVLTEGNTLTKNRVVNNSEGLISIFGGFINGKITQNNDNGFINCFGLRDVQIDGKLNRICVYGGSINNKLNNNSSLDGVSTITGDTPKLSFYMPSVSRSFDMNFSKDTSVLNYSANGVSNSFDIDFANKDLLLNRNNWRIKLGSRNCGRFVLTSKVQDVSNIEVDSKSIIILTPLSASASTLSYWITKKDGVGFTFNTNDELTGTPTFEYLVIPSYY